MIRRTLGLLTALMILWTGCIAAAEEKGEFPALNDAGFLDSGEFVWEDDENGVWRYASDTLRIEIFRRQQKQPARVWYEAEVFCAEGSAGPRMIANDPGILIRDGKVWSDRTKKKGVKDFPNLDCLAIWPDGDMKVYYSNEKTAEEYLADGAIDVLAFGPILIRDGKLNEEALKKYGTSHAQRTAVGMVEKGHYFFMMLEGRIKRSKGDGISFLAEKLQEKGCTLAFNLDGGETACIVFMGHQLCKLKDRKKPLSSRRTSDILGVGTSELLPTVSDPW